MIKVGIHVIDTAFGQAFVRGLAKESRAMMFFLLDNLEMIDEFDLVLSFVESHKPNMVQLIRNPKEENIYEAPPYRVFCYKDSRRLLKDLLFLFYRISGQNVELSGERQCRLLAFTAMGGGYGCTTMALSMGRTLYRTYGCRCLYLNLCPINDSKRYLKEDDEHSLLTLFYYLDSEKEFPIASFISISQDLDYINTGVMNLCCDEMHHDLLNRLLCRIEQLCEYEFLIVDMGTHFSSSNKNILQQAEEVVLLRQCQEESPDPYFMQLEEQIQKMVKKGGLIVSEVQRLQNDDSFTSVEQETRRLAKRIMEETPL